MPKYTDILCLFGYTSHYLGRTTYHTSSISHSDHISVMRLHNEMKLLSLEYRRHMQLLKLLFHRSKKPVYLKTPVRNTRANTKVKVDVMSRTTTKYLNSPFLRGTVLWDNLSVESHKSRNVYEFKKRMLRPLYGHFEDLL